MDSDKTAPEPGKDSMVDCTLTLIQPDHLTFVETGHK